MSPAAIPSGGLYDEAHTTSAKICQTSIQLTLVTDRAAESAASGKRRLIVQVRKGDSST